MDISEDYRLMCEKCEDIQKLFKPEEHNFLYDYILRTSAGEGRYKYKEYRIYNMSEKYRVNYHIPHSQHIWGTGDGYEWSCIWLPRQDQLQELIGCIGGSHKEIMREFCDAEYFYSLEQKWLAFVMLKKFHKVWKGNDWVLK
jgi:hypothetical protein